MRNSFAKGELNEISLTRLRISAAVAAPRAARSGHLYEDRVVRIRFATSGVIVGLPT